MSTSDAKPDLALYIHWPFCRQKCPYCDFNSHVSTTHDSAEFGTALC
ncbi:MAG: coproporphyrinogen III oxidase, partial [Candidatus Puniceispirillaceae bacterium]